MRIYDKLSQLSGDFCILYQRIQLSMLNSKSLFMSKGGNAQNNNNQKNNQFSMPDPIKRNQNQMQIPRKGSILKKSSTQEKLQQEQRQKQKAMGSTPQQQGFTLNLGGQTASQPNTQQNNFQPQTQQNTNSMFSGLKPQTSQAQNPQPNFSQGISQPNTQLPFQSNLNPGPKQQNPPSFMQGGTQPNTQPKPNISNLNAPVASPQSSLSNQNGANSSASTLNRSPVSKLNPIKFLNKYVKTYNPLSQFDILNYFYQMKQQPEQVEQHLILTISKTLKNLFKTGSQAEGNYTVDRIKFTQLTSVQEPNLTNIRKFWVALITQFIKNHHPYCTFDGIASLIQFHFKQNHDTYYPNGQLNYQIYRQNQILEGVINKNSQFFTTIIYTLQRMLSVFVNQFCSIIATIPNNIALKLLNKEEITTNIWNVFKLLYNNDYQVKDENLIRLKIATDLMSALYIIHNKNPACYSKSIVADFITYFDSHAQYISRNLDIRVPASQDKSQSSLLGRKCIRLINMMLFRFPYQIEKWDQPLKNCIRQIKSQCLIPLKWIIHHKKPQSMTSSIFSRSNLSDEDVDYKNYYFPIVGSEWMLLLHNLIQHQQSAQSANQYFREIIFYLVCSVIEQNPTGFWSDLNQYQQIHNYISTLFASLPISGVQNDSQYSSELGKLCRIMLCACGKLSLHKQNPDNCQQVLQKLKHDSIMLKILSNQSQQHQYHTLSNLVFNNFASNIIGVKGIDRRALFGQVLMGYLITHQQQYPIYNFDDPIIVKYHYQFPNLLIHQLFIRILMDTPQIITQLYQLWQHQYCKYYEPQPESPVNSPQTKLANFLYKFTIVYTINIQQSYFLKQQQYQPEYSSLESIQILPHILQLFNKMLLNQSTRDIVCQLLHKDEVMRQGEMEVLLEKCMVYETNVNALCRHVEVLYQLGLESIPWVSVICMPIIEKLLGQWEECVARHYANITRIAVHRQCLSLNSHPSLGQLNALAIDPRTQLLRSEVKNSQSYLLKIQQLTKYSDYVLEFIMWTLRIQEDILRQEYFYNTLFNNARYQSLEAGLNLLEVLIIVYMKFHDRVYFTQKLKRFLAICNVSTKLGSSFPNSKLSIAPQIPLSNKKLATLPAALTYLICQPYLKKSRRSADNQTIKAKQIRSKALNILNLIILNNNTSIPFLYSVQDATQSLQDSFSSIDFNVYEQFFINDSQKIYCSSEKILIEFIKSELSNRNSPTPLTPPSWFQSSYNHGQCIDIAAQTNKLFNSADINDAIQTRINMEYENGEKLRLDMRKAMTKFYLENSFGGKVNNIKNTIAGILGDYLCDREIAAYSRYLLQFAIMYRESNPEQEQFFLKLLAVVLNKLLNVIVEEPECNEKSIIIQPITTNIWKIIRILQTKKDLRFFIKTVKKAMPFILSTYHLGQHTDQYVNEYLITLRLVLACREYFTSIQYRQILSVDCLKEMLIALMRQAAEKPRFYTVLFYCLNFYYNSVENEKSSMQQFKAQLLSLYNSVNQTINPVLINDLKRLKKKSQKKPEIHELCNDVNVVQLIMFFKLHIPDQISSRSQSLYNLLLTSSADRSATFNYQSLLLNIEPNPTPQSIEAALKIANASHHYLEYISACNHIYRALGNLDKWAIDQEQWDPAQNLMAEKILAFIERGLDIQPANDMSRQGENWRNIAFMKSWACNLLYLLMGFCSRPLLIKICHMLLNKSSLISLLGQLLSIYGSIQIRWEYTGSKTVSMSRLGLLEKQLLLSILKVYSVMIAKNDDWLKKSGDMGRANVYYGLCKSFVSASKVLNKNSSKFSNFDSIRDNRASQLNPLPGSTARTQFEQNLEKITRDYIYKPNLLTLENRLQQANLPMRSSEPNFKIEPSKLQLLHPECNNSLDIIHSHLNLLITQQYLMILMGCYSNQHLTLQTYEYHEILSIFQATAKRLADIYDYRQIFQNAMIRLDSKLWNCYRMDTNLYYLNTIQESPRETLDLLNSVAEICFNCIVNLKGIMEMHKDYREFITRTDKTLRQAVKADKALTFGLRDLMEAHGFDKKSQYTTSYMMSPSARLSR